MDRNLVQQACEAATLLYPECRETQTIVAMMIYEALKNDTEELEHPILWLLEEKAKALCTTS